MTYPSWPSTVPHCPVRNSVQGGPLDARVSFTTDSGLSIERPRTTADVESFDITMVPMTVAQYTIFAAWVRDDLKRGSLPFAWWHPLTGAATRWKFAPGAPPYQVAEMPKGYIEVRFRVVGLPGATWFAPYLPAGTLEVPSMVLDFANQVYGVDGVRKTFADIVTFTRAGSANYVDANGVTQSAAANEPRFDHDPVSPHAPLGLLMDDTDGDLASITAVRWPSGLFATAGSMLVACRSQQTAAPTYRNVFEVKGATVNDRIDLSVISTAVSVRVVAGGVSQANIGHGTYTVGTRLAVAASLVLNNFRSSRAGGAVVSDLSGTLPTVNNARIGVAEDRVRVEKIVLWNKVLTDAQLQGLSA